MPACPYCEGDVSATARKCKHCGEWIAKPAASSPAAGGLLGRGGDSLGKAANRYVSFQMVMAVVGVGLFLFVFVTWFLPIGCQMRNTMDRFPGNGPPDILEKIR